MNVSHDLLKKFLAFNHDKKLFSKGEKIGLCVSGGLDSVVLLDLFVRIRDAWGLDIVVLHFNHKLRADADDDADFVAALSEHFKLHFECGQQEVAHIAEQQKISVEMAARQCRYTYFDDIATILDLDKIATGHTASDQAETVLLHIVRGSGLNGLRGIPLKRGRIIRPLLCAQRREIHVYAIARGLQWREDSSNQDEKYRRNRVRHTLLPLLQAQFNPQITKALNRLSESAGESSLIMKRAGRKAFRNATKHTADGKIILEIERFLAYLKSLQRLILQQILDESGHDPRILSFSRFENILSFLRAQQSGRTLRIKENFSIMISGRFAIFGEVSEEKRHFLIINKGPGRYELWNGLFLEIKEILKPLILKSKNRESEYVDADSIVDPLIVRSYQDADYFYPINGAGKKKLSDFFIDEKIPFYDREHVPVLESAGKIVWIGGLRMDDRFKITEQTSRIFKLRIGTREQKNSF